jgi:hypothetical protein
LPSSRPSATTSPSNPSPHDPGDFPFRMKSEVQVLPGPPPALTSGNAGRRARRWLGGTGAGSRTLTCFPLLVMEPGDHEAPAVQNPAGLSAPTDMQPLERARSGRQAGRDPQTGEQSPQLCVGGFDQWPRPWWRRCATRVPRGGPWPRATRVRETALADQYGVHLAAELGFSRPQCSSTRPRSGCRVVPPPTASRWSRGGGHRRDRVRRGRVAGADSAGCAPHAPRQAGHHRRRGHRPAALEQLVLYTGVRPTDD